MGIGLSEIYIGSYFELNFVFELFGKFLFFIIKTHPYEPLPIYHVFSQLCADYIFLSIKFDYYSGDICINY